MGIQPFVHAFDSPFAHVTHRLVIDIKLSQLPVDPGKLLQLLQIFGLLCRKGQYRKQLHE